MSSQIAILEAAYEAQVAENMRLMEILRSRKAIGFVIAHSENQFQFKARDGLILEPGIHQVFTVKIHDFEE